MQVNDSSVDWLSRSAHVVDGVGAWYSRQCILHHIPKLVSQRFESFAIFVDHREHLKTGEMLLVKGFGCMGWKSESDAFSSRGTCSLNVITDVEQLTDLLRVTPWSLCSGPPHQWGICEYVILRVQIETRWVARVLAGTYFVAHGGKIFAISVFSLTSSFPVFFFSFPSHGKSADLCS